MARLLTRGIALLALAGLAACSEPVTTSAPPSDRFHYPTGLALTTISTPQGNHTGLVVVSSNFDLLYGAPSGGTVHVVDVDETVARAQQNTSSPGALVVAGFAQIGSFGGDAAVLDGNSCSTWVNRETGGKLETEILVASRSQDALYKITMAADGSLTCDPSRAPCKVPLAPTLSDPFGVAVACGTFPEPKGSTVQDGFDSNPRAYAFVTYGQSTKDEGWLSRLDLLAPEGPAATMKQLDLGVSQTYAAAFDQNHARLYVTSRFATVGFNPLRWFSVATQRLDSELAPLNPSTLDLGAIIAGSDSRGIALSSDGSEGRPPTRAYVALRMYDVNEATSLGGRTSDVSGALAVIDLTEQPQGGPAASVLRVVPLDLGPTEVKVIPRTGTGKRDLVAVTSTDASSLTLYDDETGEIARVFGLCGSSATGNAGAPPPCDPGKPLLGAQPFGLAVQPEMPVAGHARLFVGSFDRSWVNVIEIDPAKPQDTPISWVRIGPERSGAPPTSTVGTRP